nr:hypothetical protein [Rhizorhabdus wittichii]
MACPDAFRAEYSCRNAATQSFQKRDDRRELSVRIPRDVLAEETMSPAFVEDAHDLVDEESFVVGAEPASGDAVGLAGIARSDEMNAATERSSVEGSKVRPDKRRSQLSRFHARDQCRGGIGFPLHVSDSARSGFGKLQGEVEPACARADANGVEAVGT